MQELTAVMTEILKEELRLSRAMSRFLDAEAVRDMWAAELLMVLITVAILF